MRLKYFSVILLIVVTFTAFTQNIDAQTAQKKPNSVKKGGVQKPEVVNFAASFMAVLEETKDLRQIPQSFFVKDFAARFAKNPPLDIDVEPAVFNRFSENQRFEFNAAFFDFGYAGLMNAFGRVNLEDNTNEENDIESVKNLFPPQIVSIIKNSRAMNTYFTEDFSEYNSNFKIKNAETFNAVFADLKKITDAQRVSLTNRPPPEKEKYAKNMNKLRKAANWTKSEICRKTCEDFPRNTRIYELRFYPLYFKIVKENGDLKIFNLQIGAID